MWIGFSVHLPLLGGVPSLVSHTVFVNIESPTLCLTLSPCLYSASLAKEQLGEKEENSSIDIWGAEAVRGLGDRF